MSGNCYSGASKNLLSKFKERGTTIDKMSKEVKDLKLEVKNLKASLADSRRRNGKSGSGSGSGGATGQRQPTAGGLKGGARTLNEKVAGESRGLEFLNGNINLLDNFYLFVRLLP